MKWNTGKAEMTGKEEALEAKPYENEAGEACKDGAGVSFRDDAEESCRDGEEESCEDDAEESYRDGEEESCEDETEISCGDETEGLRFGWKDILALSIAFMQVAFIRVVIAVGSFALAIYLLGKFWLKCW